MAGNKTLKDLNLEAVIFSLGIGLLIGNLVNLPDWLRSSLSTELFVKIGLVLLGTSVIFGDVLKAGSLGLIQALVVVISVWYFAFWVCKKLKVDSELTMMLSSAVSICGVSAAIATSGAIDGDSKKLSYVISLVLITAIPMMLLSRIITSGYRRLARRNDRYQWRRGCRRYACWRRSSKDQYHCQIFPKCTFRCCCVCN